MNPQLQQMLNQIASSSEEERKKIIEICLDIESRLFRMARGNPEVTAEVLDAREERIKSFGS
jgi:ribosome-binding ATPase YchF (GTP1/OBG family)